MVTLSDAEKNEISLSGGIPSHEWAIISFDKKKKPNRAIKKLLRLHGYTITKKSGSKFESIMEYELDE